MIDIPYSTDVIAERNHQEKERQQDIFETVSQMIEPATTLIVESMADGHNAISWHFVYTEVFERLPSPKVTSVVCKDELIRQLTPSFRDKGWDIWIEARPINGTFICWRPRRSLLEELGRHLMILWNG